MCQTRSRDASLALHCSPCILAPQRSEQSRARRPDGLEGRGKGRPGRKTRSQPASAREAGKQE